MNVVRGESGRRFCMKRPDNLLPKDAFSEPAVMIIAALDAEIWYIQSIYNQSSMENIPDSAPADGAEPGR